MEIIEEIKSSKEEKETFQFEPIQAKFFEDKLGDKKTSDLLMKWFRKQYLGLLESLKFATFRFNLKFNELNHKQFLKDFFNSMEVRQELNFLPIGSDIIDEVQYEKLKCSLINVTLFDKFEKEEIVIEDRIKGTFQEFYEDIEINDLVKEVILKEDSENYCIFSENDRQELLFRVFSALCLGGSLCQWEDNLSPYVDMTKMLYKNLVWFNFRLNIYCSARKDPATENIFIESYAFQITKIGKVSLFDPHPQSFLYLIVSPGLRQAKVMYNKWKKFW